MKPPKELKKQGKKFFLEVLSDFQLEEKHHFELLKQACMCLDTIETAREAIEKDGEYTKNGTGEPKPHPGVKTIKEYRTLWVRVLRELALDIEAPKSKTTPGLYK